MASDRQDFKRATKKWHELHTAHNYSVPAQLGSVAIFCQINTKEPISTGNHAENELFKNEADAIWQNVVAHGRTADIIYDGKGNDFNTVLREPNVSSIITIGHGTLSCLNMQNGMTLSMRNLEPKQNHIYDWYDVSVAADHLKTGSFTQRHCGRANRELAVPLGTFALADQTRLYAPTNIYFTPKSLDDPQNENLMPVIFESPITFDAARELHREYLDIDMLEVDVDQRNAARVAIGLEPVII